MRYPLVEAMSCHCYIADLSIDNQPRHRRRRLDRARRCRYRHGRELEVRLRRRLGVIGAEVVEVQRRAIAACPQHTAGMRRVGKERFVSAEEGRRGRQRVLAGVEVRGRVQGLGRSGRHGARSAGIAIRDGHCGRCRGRKQTGLQIGRQIVKRNGGLGLAVVRVVGCVVRAKEGSGRRDNVCLRWGAQIVPGLPWLDALDELYDAGWRACTRATA